ncbi:MAG: putative integral membrane protein linked to a cation pump [Candidatus Accumulibacter phosphatis]|uniref:Putative integral membrane protein linked to a cation pump n=1 Tax=Candidatus Accumulibacter phosphatis TaxID=327160 RepID=A0A080M0A0_9PROT|nr:FixH family protein [Accumulibacter sp.]KFB74536.1 MAG: putative integral membrane protein linked to a cation pump [Candidatus Accumulibacter phosphatis]HRF12540.1 FixH family protein [Candidatus Accumulibacter phosphatis]
MNAKPEAMNPKLNVSSAVWYREPWPWLLMLGPGSVIVAGIFTAYLAVVSSDGLVEDDYYKQGLTVNQRTARDQRAVELGIEAELLIGADGDRIRALLHSKEGVLLPETLSMRITHPTRQGFDQQVLLHSEGGTVYAGAVKPFSGRWHITLEDEGQAWRLVGDWVTGKQSVLRLPASAIATAASKGNSD